jgi:spore coat polysaccharide biosynthesis predicted glycosyltransferase SpsG
MVGPEKKYMLPGDKALFNDWIVNEYWSSAEDEAYSFLDIAKQHGVEAAVLDDYRVDECYQLALRRAGLPWTQFDGFANKPLWADIIVNANPAAKPDDYKRVLRNRQANLLLGPEYAVLRSEFLRIERTNRSDDVSKVLVTFGGGDDRGAILFVLSTLIPSTSENIHFLVVSGSHNPRNAEIKAWIEKYSEGRIDLAINPPEIARLFTNCDLAIMGGGTTTYEAAACGLPMLLIAIADNQLPQSKAWQENGVAIFLGMLPDVSNGQLVDIFLQVTRGNERRLGMMNQARKLVDGKGALRVAEIVGGLTQ